MAKRIAKKVKKTVKKVTKKKVVKKVAKKKITKKIVKKPAKRKTAKKVAKKSVKKKTHKCNKKDTLNIINDTLTQLECQAIKAYECAQAVKKRGETDWKEWVGKLSKQDWIALANAQRERIGLEIQHLSNEILKKIHSAEVLTQKDSILDDAKSSLENIIQGVEKSDLVGNAVDTTIHTKDGLLAFLNIPTHEEMVHLQRKLKRLERRMNELN